MSNRRISELNQLFPGDIERSDYLLVLDVNAPETKKLLVGDITDFVVGQAGGVTSGSIQELSASVAAMSSSVADIISQTGSFATISDVNNKLDNSLTASFNPLLVAYGLPTLGADGLVYPNFLPDSVFTFNSRSADVLPLYGDYSSSMIPFDSSSDVPQTNVQAAIDYLGTNKLDLSGDTMTGPLVLAADPISGSEAATKDYADLHVKKSGDTMTGTLDTSGIIVSTDLIYAVTGTSSVGIGTTNPTESAKLHVAGRIRVDEIQFSGDESIQTTAGAGAGGVSSFNTRTGTVNSEKDDYLGFYVDSFNGRSGSVSAQNDDYDGYYVKTTGSSTIIEGGIIFENGKISFEDAASAPHDTASIKFFRDDLDGRVLNTGIYENATSSLNNLIQPGDFAIILESTLVGSEEPEYDTGTEAIVIGPYTSGSKGLRISNSGTLSPNRFESYGYTEMGGQVVINGNTTIAGTLVGDGSFVLSGSTILDGFASASTMDVAGPIQARENIYSTGHIYMASKDGVDVNYGSIFASELYILPRSEDGSGQITISVPSTISGTSHFVAPVTTSAPLLANAPADFLSPVTTQAGLSVSGGELVVSQSITFIDASVQTTAFSPFTTSSTYTIDTPITASHGLGRHPFMLQAKLRCVTVDGTFNIDDEVPIILGSSSIYSTPSNIYFLPKAPLIREKDGLTDAVITDANWEIVLTAI